MKTLLEYLINKNTKPEIQWHEKEYLNLKYAEIKGEFTFEFESREPDVEYNVSCDKWYVAVIERNVIFWSEYSDWMPYFYIEEVRGDKINWAVASRNYKELNDVLKESIGRWDDYLIDAATVPEVDYIKIPPKFKEVINYILEK
jgi:hypothetical protein